ncbi:NHL repeat-containing protein [Mycolicibacterium arenosum]|uniref:Lipoprotein n=1 Tax=Mycolicibacterium arenosum TaxID=2952157 RepID=A0ABT1MAB2_9MYCO|nr:hypothetical protein [Mycolicibacterium sp. CAU 1645]MCP9276101.1 hypothetical protein [Mycolicibacterium sp. CAU 1645]
MVFIAVSACSSNPGDTPDSGTDAPAAIAPAAAAVSPPVGAAPDGVVLPLSEPVLSSVFDGGTRSLVAIVGPADSATELGIYPARGAGRVVALPAPVTAIATDGDGAVYLANRGGYTRVDVRSGRLDSVDVDGHPDTRFTAITLRADGRVALGSDSGGVYTIAPDHSVAARIETFARVDELAAQGDTVFALDRSQTSVTTVEPGGDETGPALRAGQGATTMVTDTAGRLLVADTRGGQLLVFGSDPLMLRQQYPVPGAPYGLASSPTLTWVSETASNIVVGYDLGTGIPVEKVRYRTVRQPNSLAYDDDTGTLYVASGVGEGVQVIATRTAP